MARDPHAQFRWRVSTVPSIAASIEVIFRHLQRAPRSGCAAHHPQAFDHPARCRESNAGREAYLRCRLPRRAGGSGGCRFERRPGDMTSAQYRPTGYLDDDPHRMKPGARMDANELLQIAALEMRAHGLLPEFTSRALREAAAAAPAASGGEVRDLRGLLWFSIDNTDTLDLDQLSWAEALPGARGQRLHRVTQGIEGGCGAAPARPHRRNLRCRRHRHGIEGHLRAYRLAAGRGQVGARLRGARRRRHPEAQAHRRRYRPALHRFRAPERAAAPIPADARTQTRRRLRPSYSTRSPTRKSAMSSNSRSATLPLSKRTLTR